MTANERQTKATEEWLVLLKIYNELNEEESVFYVPALKCPGYLRQPFSICPPTQKTEFWASQYVTNN